MRLGFGQSGFTVAVPIADGHEGALRETLRNLSSDPAGTGTLRFEDLPNLHFCSLTILPHQQRPWLIFEGSIDGPVKTFLAGLAKSQRSGIDAVFGHCEGYGGSQPDAYLLAHDKGFNTLFVGCPGRTVEQIRLEEALRVKISQFIDDANSRGVAVSRELIQTFVRMQPEFESFAHRPYERPFLVRYGTPLLWGAAALMVLMFLVLGWFCPRWVGSLGRVVVLLVVLAYLWLRHLEKTDPPAENRVYDGKVSATVEHEDLGVSNHMASTTQIKPGLFRLTLLRLVLKTVHFAGLLVSNKGELGGIPSIHFARWLILDGKALIFLSNYGGSWESYLNDFIDKAYIGLTAVWSNTVGFPRSRSLIFEGAQSEREFKVYARNSQFPTLVWYRAYSDLITSNIENNTRTREGLVGPMTSAEVGRWLVRL